MARTVLVSHLGQVLRRRGMRVADLQRLLERRGLHVSRGTISRLVSDEPFHDPRLQALKSMLEVLEVDLDEAFEEVNSETAAARARARAEAEMALTSLTGRAEVRLALRERYPELFDARGRLRQRELARHLDELLASGEALTGDDLTALALAYSPELQAELGMREWVTVGEAAVLAGVGRQLIERWVADGAVATTRDGDGVLVGIKSLWIQVDRITAGTPAAQSGNRVSQAHARRQQDATATVHPEWPPSPALAERLAQVGLPPRDRASQRGRVTEAQTEGLARSHRSTSR